MQQPTPTSASGSTRPALASGDKRSVRRHHRERVIRRRVAIIRNVFAPAYPERHRELSRPGILDKSHLTDCACWMCHGEGYERAKAKREAAALLGASP